MTTSALAVVAWFVLAVQSGSAFQGSNTTYTLYTADAKRSVIIRPGSPETLALEQLAGTFGLKFTEDRAANGLVIATKGESIFAFPGQSFVRASGHIIQLDGPVQRERNAWVVPIDFLTKALGPALGQPVLIRRGSRLIIVGAVRVPEVAIRIERTAAGARVALAVQPLAPHTTKRDGNKLTIHFDATALDATPASGFIAEFASAARVNGTDVVIDLGPQAVVMKEAEDRTAGLITVDLMPAPPPPPPPPPSPTPGAGGGRSSATPTGGLKPAGSETAGPPQIDMTAGLRTIAIDAGHGGDDAGAVSAGGAKEKDLTLQVSRRLKATIEARLGLRVLMTRDNDDTITLDQRTEIANNNKADAFISLHANWSARPNSRGAQIYTPSVDQPKAGGAFVPDARQVTVPVVGGGSRRIDAVPWDLAQLPYADQSSAFGSILERQLTDHQVTLFARPVTQAPMRILRGAHMPAVLIELGFLSNGDDEKLLASADFQTNIVESIIAALTEVRRGSTEPRVLEPRVPEPRVFRPGDLPEPRR